MHFFAGNVSIAARILMLILALILQDCVSICNCKVLGKLKCMFGFACPIKSFKRWLRRPNGYMLYVLHFIYGLLWPIIMAYYYGLLVLFEYRYLTKGVSFFPEQCSSSGLVLASNSFAPFQNSLTITRYVCNFYLLPFLTKGLFLNLVWVEMVTQ